MRHVLPRSPLLEGGLLSVLVESFGTYCQYKGVIDIRESPKDQKRKYQKSKSFGAFETFWIEYVVQTYTCKFGQRFTLKSERALHAGPSRVERPYLKCE